MHTKGEDVLGAYVDIIGFDLYNVFRMYDEYINNNAYNVA
jgi:hypothetical protein